MAENSKIEWTDHTFNPWIGCQKVSPGCDHCYAETWDARGLQHLETRWGPHAARTRTSAANWRKPLAWNKVAKETGSRARVFCASLADVFDNHRSIQPEWRADLWALIAATPHLDWLLLTKRPQNIDKMLPHAWNGGWPNVWLGTTVENQTEADRRIPHLLAAPAAVRFLSVEPMLGPVDLHSATCRETGSCLTCPACLGGIHWVICGGESGPGARPMHPDWARSLRDQCRSAGVPFFFKQWGEWGELHDHEGRRDWMLMHHDGQVDMPDYRWPDEEAGEVAVVQVGKARAGRLLDGRAWDQVPGGANA